MKIAPQQPSADPDAPDLDANGEPCLTSEALAYQEQHRDELDHETQRVLVEHPWLLTTGVEPNEQETPAVPLAMRYAAQALRHAKAVATLSQDPTAGDALEVIKVALLGMVGKRGRDLPPLDCLASLSTALKGGRKAESDAATLRLLYELIDVRVRRIYPDGKSHQNRTPQAHARMLNNESQSLARDIVGHLGSKWAGATEDRCRDWLARWARRGARGSSKKPSKLTTSGVIREIVLCVGAMPYKNTAYDRRELEKRIEQSLRRA